MDPNSTQTFYVSTLKRCNAMTRVEINDLLTTYEEPSKDHPSVAPSVTPTETAPVPETTTAEQPTKAPD